MDITQSAIEIYLEPFRGREVHINTILKDLELKDGDAKILRELLCGRLRLKHLTKPSGKRDGWFKVLPDIKPVKVIGVDSSRFFNLTFPGSHRDMSCFGFEDLFNVSEGDLIVIAGTSNVGKTTLALSILGENVTKHPCMLMGSEHASSDGFILPKFKRRLERMKWAPLFKDGELTFKLLPVVEDYEDWVEQGKINIIDWIALDEKLWLVGNTLKGIKDAAGKGITIAVLQKKHGTNYAYGQEATEHYADVYMTIDQLGKFESMLTLGKVKDYKARVRGRTWGFEVVDNGANIMNIRELKPCPRCKGRGSNFGAECEPCLGKGYMDKEELRF